MYLFFIFTLFVLCIVSMYDTYIGLFVTVMYLYLWHTRQIGCVVCNYGWEEGDADPWPQCHCEKRSLHYTVVLALESTVSNSWSWHGNECLEFIGERTAPSPTTTRTWSTVVRSHFSLHCAGSQRSALQMVFPHYRPAW